MCSVCVCVWINFLYKNVEAKLKAKAEEEAVHFLLADQLRFVFILLASFNDWSKSTNHPFFFVGKNQSVA